MSKDVPYYSPNKELAKEIDAGRLDITKGERVVAKGVSRSFCILVFCSKLDRKLAFDRALESTNSDILLDGKFVRKSWVFFIGGFSSVTVTGRVLKSSEIRTVKGK